MKINFNNTKQNNQQKLIYLSLFIISITILIIGINTGSREFLTPISISLALLDLIIYSVLNKFKNKFLFTTILIVGWSISVLSLVVQLFSESISDSTVSNSDITMFGIIAGSFFYAFALIYIIVSKFIWKEGLAKTFIDLLKVNLIAIIVASLIIFMLFVPAMPEYNYYLIIPITLITLMASFINPPERLIYSINKK